jgi:tRNA(Leu) C34 or U34 (ribose-2'-O)-methylase TrmL
MRTAARLAPAFAGRPEAVGATPAVILWNPKYGHNVSAVLRSCACLDARELWWTGRRVALDESIGERLPREERMKGYRAVALVNDDRPFDRIGRGPTYVAVEVCERSQSLTDFIHPREAVYVFGPEDGSISEAVRAQCHQFVHMPARHCLNLATAVSCVLMHRWQQEELDGRRERLPLSALLDEQRG